jgi:hypothetical protein
LLDERLEALKLSGTFPFSSTLFVYCSPDGNEQRTDNAATEATAAILTGTTCAEPSHAPEISLRGGDLTNGSPGISKSGLRHPLLWLDLEMTGLRRDTRSASFCLVAAYGE